MTAKRLLSKAQLAALRGGAGNEPSAPPPPPPPELALLIKDPNRF